jgi:hypothetical protein
MNRTQSTKKGSTKGKPKTEDLDALAHHISEALRIMRESEHIPARIYNHFSEGFLDIQNTVNDDEFLHSEPHVRLYLAALVKKGGAK